RKPASRGYQMAYQGPCRERHAVPHFVRSNPSLELCGGDMHLLKLLRLVGARRCRRQIPRDIDPALFVCDAIVRVEFGNRLQIACDITGLLLQLMPRGLIERKLLLHASAWKFEAFAVRKIAVLIHEDEVSVLENGNDEARSL